MSSLAVGIWWLASLLLTLFVLLIIIHMYKFYYNPCVPIHTLSQVMSSKDKIDFCNHVAIPEYRKTGDTASNADILANLVRLNWLVDNLATQPMVKPVVATHNGNGIWQTVVGDTRLAALELLNQTHTRVILQSVNIPEHPDCPTGWIELPNISSVGLLAGVNSGDVLTDPEDWQNNELYWMEFETPIASKHLHDANYRLRCIHNYIDNHPDFVVDKDWLSKPVNWQDYDY